MKIAIIHDWLNTLGGAERVLIELHKIFPAAPIYTTFANKNFVDKYLPKAEIRTSFLQKIPGIRFFYKFAIPLMPVAVETFDLGEFNIVLSSSVSFSKGLILKPQTRHFCYCYSPTRFLWDRHSIYESDSWFSKILRHFLRLWDRNASERVDQFVAISEHVRKRIKKYYQKEARVIYPPVPKLKADNSHKLNFNDFYLIVSRLHPHKNIDIAIDAFNKLGYRLIIIGAGPDMRRLKKMARSNIVFLGHLPDEEVANFYQSCKSFIMPQEEDFGLTPVEAMSFGKPILALRRGGALETVIEGVTGEFFDDPIPEALADGVRRLNESIGKYDKNEIIAQASKFSVEKFKKEILELIENRRII